MVNWMCRSSESFLSVHSRNRRCIILQLIMHCTFPHAPGGLHRQPVFPETVARLVALSVLVGACTGNIHHSGDFERHRHSQLVQPAAKPEAIFFDVLFSPDYPAADPAADATREAWLDAWLRQRQLCAAGHEVVTRRPFDYLEDNPGRYQERWEVRCLPPQADRGAGG